MDLKIGKTRFPGLGYIRVCNEWRVIDTSSQKPSLRDVTGMPYKTRAELLSDLSRIAEEWGY